MTSDLKVTKFGPPQFFSGYALDEEGRLRHHFNQPKFNQRLSHSLKIGRFELEIGRLEVENTSVGARKLVGLRSNIGRKLVGWSSEIGRLELGNWSVRARK